MDHEDCVCGEERCESTYEPEEHRDEESSYLWFTDECLYFEEGEYDDCSDYEHFYFLTTYTNDEGWHYCDCGHGSYFNLIS